MSEDSLLAFLAGQKGRLLSGLFSFRFRKICSANERISVQGIILVFYPSSVLRGFLGYPELCP